MPVAPPEDRVIRTQRWRQGPLGVEKCPPPHLFRKVDVRANAMSNLQHEIGSLSTAEKFELPDVLWESLEADAPSLTDEQRAELDHRAARYERNPSDVISWEQVRASMTKKKP